MANLYLYLDKRTPRKDGSGSLKVAITHKHQTVYHPLETYIKPEEWDATAQQVVVRPDKKFLNVLLKKRMAEMTLALQRILLRDDADTEALTDQGKHEPHGAHDELRRGDDVVLPEPLIDHGTDRVVGSDEDQREGAEFCR